MGQRSGLCVTGQGCGSEVRVVGYKSRLWVIGQGCSLQVKAVGHRSGLRLTGQDCGSVARLFSMSHKSQQVIGDQGFGCRPYLVTS